MRELRSLDLAEEALQEAHLAAVQQWEHPPENPAGWLLTVARRRARDRLRREATLARKLPLLVVEDEAGEDEPPDAEDGERPGDADVTTIADERLRLVFLACHPALAPEAQVALTLRYVAGLTTREIARLFLVSEPTMAARLTRAKRKLAEAGIPFRVPSDADLPARLVSALAVVYLVFTEGYAPTSGSRAVREELCAEAIRLGHLLHELMRDEPEVGALLALMRLQHARRDARVHSGRLVPLADQDRGSWKHAEVAQALDLLAAACRHGRPGPYVFQALIAAEHTSPRPGWRTIAALYAQLERLLPSPAVRLNRAVAVAEADGPAAGLRLLEGLEHRLPSGHQLPLARAELLLRLGRREEALAGLDAAVAQAGNGMTRTHGRTPRGGSGPGVVAVDRSRSACSAASLPYAVPYLRVRKTSVYLSEAEAERLAALARREGRPQAEVLRAALADYADAAANRRTFALFDAGEGPGDSIAAIDEDALLEGFGE